MVENMNVDSSTTIAAVHCNALLAYREKDAGTGRCRLSVSMFTRLSLKTGWILKVSITRSDGTMLCTCFCTAWPDTFNALNDDNISVDDSVIISSGSKDKPMWLEGICHVLHITSPHYCRSFHVNFLPKENLYAASFLGLVVAPGTMVISDNRTRQRNHTIISVNHHASGQGQDVNNMAAVVHMDTIILPAPLVTSTKINKDEVMTVSKTAVVDELLRKIVRPYLILPRAMHVKGVLLLGPPGVGKTFAVKALQTVCEMEEICTVVIKEISIPDVLAADNPLDLLASILMTTASNENDHTSNEMLPTKDMETPGKAVSGSTGEMNNASSSSNASPGSSGGSSLNSNVRTPHTWSVSSPPSSAKSKLKTDTASSASRPPSIHRPYHQTSLACRKPVITVIVIDEIDALGRQDNSPSVMQESVVKQYMCSWFDRQSEDPDNARTCIISTSNRPADVDARLRRGGRLELEIDVLGSASDRARLIETQLCVLFHPNDEESTTPARPSKQNIHDAANIIAEKTGGYVAADINALVAEARKNLAEWTKTQYQALTEQRPQDPSHSTPSQMTSLLIQSFDHAMHAVGPSCLRGIAIQLPNLTYDDVIGYDEVKKTLHRLLSFSSPGMRQKVKKFGLKSPGGVLLYGPPGNSKTRLILAAAASHGLPVISLSSADVYSPYVGDTEAEIRKAFRIARNASPCVLFLDEMDALVTDRASSSSGSTSGVSTEARVLATLLTEMDGITSGGGGNDDVDHNNHVIVMGATNRVDCIDAALLRKGRFHQIIHVPLPTSIERLKLLHYFANKCAVSSSHTETLQLSLKEGMSGADVENVVKMDMMRLARSNLNKG